MIAYVNTNTIMCLFRRPMSSKKERKKIKIYEILNLKSKPGKDRFIVAQLCPEFNLNLYYTGDTQASKTAFYPH